MEDSQEMALEGTQITLDISGIGIIFYSPMSAMHIAEGEDYLTSHYTTEEQVQHHIQNGTLVGFGTGTPGVFVLRFHDGYPDPEELNRCEFKLRLGLSCSGGSVAFRDLYDLLQWTEHCSPDQLIRLADGIYHVTLCSDVPASGILGDNQVIDVYLNQLDRFPALAKTGIPTLCM